jgi:iron-sulfur cluster repair protein YtfE (RIC family)
MSHAVTRPGPIDQILQEHDALRDKVHRIHSTFDEPEPNQSEIEALLREFFSALRAHFIHEEDGLFEEVTSHAPRLADRAGKLRMEHRQMLRDADELCRFAAAGSPSMPWWRELSSRCHEFNKRLMQHEHEENRLLQEARQSRYWSL